MSASRKSSEFQNYPFLNGEEFAEVCHQLDRSYLRATLGPVRQQWRLNVVRALGMSFAFDAGTDYTTYVQIVRPLQRELDLDDGGLSAHLDRFSLAAAAEWQEAEAEAEISADKEMADLEDADKEVLRPSTPVILSVEPRPFSPDKQSILAVPLSLGEPPSVAYEIHLHPTYRTPCLWFSLHGLPADEPTLDVETVFRRLVPDHFKEGLRNSGPIGGVSADHHPVTGVPTFFIHPCLLGDAMSKFDCSKEDYLMVWLGLVGACVGLWVPKEMALASA